MFSYLFLRQRYLLHKFLELASKLLFLARNSGERCLFPDRFEVRESLGNISQVRNYLSRGGEPNPRLEFIKLCFCLIVIVA